LKIRKAYRRKIMRDAILEFVKLCSETLPIREPIYEFGGYQVAGQEGWADLRRFFPGKTYIGTDMREGPGVDMILDLHNIGLSSESVGTVLMLDTLEHVEFPRKAMEEVHRILMPEGLVIMSSVMDFPIHATPYDYWRFTPEAFRSLLGFFEQSWVGFSGKRLFPHSILGIGCKKGTIQQEFFEEFEKRFSAWKDFWDIATTSGWRRVLKAVVGCLRFELYYKKR
jgi:SAM-dependent methyltransferase